MTTYSDHYQRMGNAVPDWSTALPMPERPWLPQDCSLPVLDFGCGLGETLSRLAASGFTNLTGIDLSPEQAEAGAAAAGERATILCRDARDHLRAHREHYGLIVMFDVIEHFPAEETVEVLREVYGGLLAGGAVVIRTPNMQSLGAGFSRYIDFTHRCGFTEPSLLQVLRAAGFRSPVILPDPSGRDLSRWRPLRPWRGFGMRQAANRMVHRLVYGLRGQHPMPRCFAMNLEAFAVKEKTE